MALVTATLTFLLGGAGTSSAAVAPPRSASPHASTSVAGCEGPCAIIVHIKGTGSGSITSEPSGINCRASCWAGFDEDLTVTLRARPDPGSSFLRWEECRTTTPEGSCAVYMDNVHTVCAVFADSASPLPPTSECPPLMAGPPASPESPRDTAPPDTRIVSGPARATPSRAATLRFTSTEAGSTFACKLDDARWTRCRSPKTYRKLGKGSHTFRVRARDPAGNVDRTPAMRTWRAR
ncbi:MAG: hypothetical protein M3123_05890 [Actinomycetota bacterium]|nr:hypothetical protein [Actinomycetota bacterium]